MDTQLAPAIENYAPAPSFELCATTRENDFAQLVAAGMSPAQAIVAVGIAKLDESIGVTAKVIEKQAKRLYLTPRISERIDYYHQLHQMGMNATAERVLQEAACVAYADFAQIFDEGGVPYTNPHDIPRHVRAAVKEWGFDRDGRIKVKFHDKLKGLEMMGDMAGLFNEAHAAKAPTVTVNLSAPPTSQYDCLA